jgi:hypothetical protein
MEKRLTNTRTYILFLLSNDSDMALMNLSILAGKPWLYDPPLQPEILDAHAEVYAAFCGDFFSFSPFFRWN